MGHIQRLLTVATELAAREFHIVFALRRLENSEAITRVLPSAKMLPAPVYRVDSAARKRPLAYDYADVLHRCGYDAIENLGPMVSQWRELFRLFDPALVVCDHSPTVVLAAAERIPVVHIGSGFATPPAGRSFLGLSPSSAVGAKEREAQVLQAIQEVHQRFDTPRVNRVCDLLGLAENVTCCLPELDPYKSVRLEPASGPIHKLPAPQAVSEPEFVFGYLNGDDPHTARIVESLVMAGVPSGVYVRQCPPEWEQLVAGIVVTLYTAPQKMPEALANASAVVHHGGLSTTETALVLGRPQFLFPRNLEQLLTANAVEKLGCGVNLATHGNPGDAIRRALARGTYQKASAQVAARIAARPAVNVVAQVVASCTRHLAIG
jgi:hypothetical protein